MQAGIGGALAEVAAHRSQIQWPSVCCMRKVWSMWSIFPEISRSADRKQVDVVGFHQRVDLAEGQEVAGVIEAEHRNIDCDQKSAA